LKGIEASFSSESQRSRVQAHRALRGMVKMCGVSLSIALSLTLSPSCTLPLYFLFLCLMPSVGCGNISWEIIILLPINPFLYFHAGVPIDGEGAR